MFRLCPVTSPQRDPTQECMDKNVLHILNTVRYSPYNFAIFILNVFHRTAQSLKSKRKEMDFTT